LSYSIVSEPSLGSSGTADLLWTVGVRLKAGCAAEGWLHWHVPGLVLRLRGCSASQGGWWHCPAGDCRKAGTATAVGSHWSERGGSYSRWGGARSALL